MRSINEPEFLKLMQMEFKHIRKRLRGMAMISRGIVPNVVLSRRAVERMVSAASQYMADETGEAMVGFIIEDDTPEGLPTIYVLDTISPDETAVRRSHTFQQGDNLAYEIYWWLRENWDFHRERHRGTATLHDGFDVPLIHLGDWHKQPGSMIQPSHGDHMTALSWLDDEERNMEFMLVPIVTVGYASVVGDTELEVNYITVPMENNMDMRVDWWYIHRDVRVFQPVHPKVIPEDQLPPMMKYGWHLVEPHRFTSEITAMEDDGLLVRTTLYECDGEVPQEICFFTLRSMEADKFILLVTQHNYPQSSPQAFQASFDRFDRNLDLNSPYATFDRLWEAAEPLEDPPGWLWTADKYLVDYVIALEVEMGLRQPVKTYIPLVIGEDDAALDDGRNAASAEGVSESEADDEGMATDEQAEEEAR
ncbi:MAG: hypothetical protein OXI34_00980 [Chloroflexota bacterium]|nr:hypothetical protein [Chloroflexota bacterium]MDE2947345.1 hypothetical protein [Chloroflexota bacterium]